MPCSHVYSSKCSMSHCSMYSRPFSYPTLVCDFKMLWLLRILYFPARCFLCPYLIAKSDFFKPQVMLHSNSVAHAVIRARNAMIDKMSVQQGSNHGTLVKVTPSTSGSSLPPAPSPNSPICQLSTNSWNELTLGKLSLFLCRITIDSSY